MSVKDWLNERPGAKLDEKESEMRAVKPPTEDEPYAQIASKFGTRDACEIGRALHAGDAGLICLRDRADACQADHQA